MVFLPSPFANREPRSYPDRLCLDRPCLALLLLLACLLLMVALVVSGDYATAGNNDPQWSKDTGKDVLSVALSSDGRYLASGSANGKIFLYDMDSPGSAVIEYTAGGEVKQVALSDDGRYLVAGAFDQYVYLFDRVAGLPNTPVMAYDADRNFTTVDITADGSKFTAASGDPTTSDYLYFFDLGDQTPYRTESIPYDAEQVAISDDGTAAVIGMWNRIFYYTTDEGDSSYEWYQSYGTDAHLFMRDVDIQQDGDIVVGGLSDGTLYAYTDNGSLAWNGRTNGEQNDFYSVDMNPSGSHTVAGDEFGWVYLYDDTGELTFNYRMDDSSDSYFIYDVAVSDDGERFAAASRDDKVYHFYPDEADGVYWSYESQGKDFYSVAISSSGENTAGGSANDYLYYFDAEGEPNIPPTATIDKPGSDLAVLLGREVTFEGTGEDEGTIVEYEWRSDLDGVLSDLEDFNTDGLSQGEHTISFRVKDDSGDWSDPDTVTVDVHTTPTASIEDISPSPADEGVEVTFEGGGTDDGSLERYIWTSDLDGDLYNGSTSTFKEDSLSLGRHRITLIVWDNHDVASEEVSEYLTIREVPNEQPEAIIDQVNPDEPLEGDQVELRGHGTDSDGSIVAYEWRSSIDNVVGTNKVVTYPLSRGRHTIYFKVQDDDDRWSEEVTISVEVEEALKAMLTIQPPTGDTKKVFSFRASDSTGPDSMEYLFDFGDNTPTDWSRDDLQTHQYENADTYYVSLQVRWNGRTSAEVTYDLVVTEPEELPGNTDTGDGDDGPAPGLVVVAGAILTVACLGRKRR